MRLIKKWTRLRKSVSPVASRTPASSTNTETRSMELLDFPTEIHLIIIKQVELLCLPEKLSLRNTNHYFQTLITPPSHRELLEIEAILSSRVAAQQGNSNAKPKFFACRECLRLRPPYRFSTPMLNLRARQRYCLECGLTKRMYRRGCYLEVGSMAFVWCIDCRKLRLAQRYNGGGGGTTNWNRCAECDIKAAMRAPKTEAEKMAREAEKRRRDAEVLQQKMDDRTLRRSLVINYHAMADLERLQGLSLEYKSAMRAPNTEAEKLKRQAEKRRRDAEALRKKMDDRALRRVLVINYHAAADLERLQGLSLG